MEENKDKRINASYDQDEALSFLRESARHSPSANANNIQSGSVGQNNVGGKGVNNVRPAANSPSKPAGQNIRPVQNISARSMKEQPQQNGTKRPLHSLRENVKPNSQQTVPVHQPIPRSQSAAKNEHPVTPLPNRNNVSAGGAAVRSTNAQNSVPSTQRTVQNTTSSNATSGGQRPKTDSAHVPANISRNGQQRSQIKPISPQNSSLAASVKNVAPQTKKRTENDDFEIDEITYTRQTKRVKYQSGFADSATSAVMSLVKAIVYIVAVIAISVGLAVFVIGVGNDVFKFTSDERIVSVSIPEYATIDDITDALYDAGAIKYKWAFRLWSNLKTKGKTLEFAAGTYNLSTSLNYDYLRMAFRKNTGAHVEVRITIPEGYTVDEIIELFVSKGIGTREGFVDAIQNYAFDYPFLEGLTVSPDRIYRLEGYLFPDTYNFYQDSSEVTVLKKLLDNFNYKFVEAYYARCEQLGITVDEAIILASMVEKETRYADELGFVSSVFHNRLKYSATYPYLNSDATIMYAMQHDLGGRPDSMAGEDTDYETPYNTYTNKGLPPGPIANPGLNSIKYALYPNESEYFYFVSDSSGRTLFAKTQNEHLENINTVRGN